MTLPSELLYPEDISPAKKLCSKCGESKLLDCFAVDRRVPIGRSSWCKICTSQYHKELIVRKAEARKFLVFPQFKICSNPQCAHGNALQPLSNFHKDSSSDDGHNTMCKTCILARQKLYNANNSEKRKAKCKKWYENNTEYAKEQSQKWRDEHPEQAKETKRTYYSTHKEKIKLSQQATVNKKRAYYNHMKNMYKRSHWAQKILGECHRRAKKKGVPFDMKASDLFDPKTGAVPEFCPIFPHIRIDYNGGPDRRCWPSVDRIVPELGYVTGNVWVISFSANTWKMNGSNPAERKRIVAIMTGTRRNKNEPSTNQPSLFDGL
jgi:hypothetical protein